MSARIGSYPRVRVEGGGSGVVSQAGAVPLAETVRKAGLDTAKSAASAPWRKPQTVHDPGKVLPDIALATALGGDCLADVTMLWAEPHLFGRVASAPTVSRLVDVLAAAGPKALTAIRTARAEVRQCVRELAGADGPAASKHHVLVDGQGIPLAVSLTGGNRNDVTQLMPLLDKVPPAAGVVGRPRRRRETLFADRGYDHDKYRRLLWKRGNRPVIAERGQPHGSGLGIFRWVVERTISWLHGFRRLRIRWERRDDIHEAFLGLATCLITHHHVQRLC
ncbi:hypothetical protein GCM10017779_62260 [Streptomyces capillispiralis]|nr:hypothetical protein GCM10017779_62260 [Streptomyces capillispiralis]